MILCWKHIMKKINYVSEFLTLVKNSWIYLKQHLSPGHAFLMKQTANDWMRAIELCKGTMLKGSISLLIYCCHQKDGVAKWRKVDGFFSRCVLLDTCTHMPVHIHWFASSRNDTQYYIVFACWFRCLQSVPADATPGERIPICMTMAERHTTYSKGRGKR